MLLGITTTNKAKDLSDEELLVRSQAEPWIFAVLLERYQDAFMRKAEGIIHNTLDAEEIVQDAFTKIYLNAHRFTPQDGASFSSWGYRILMNTAFTRYQKRIREGQRFVQLDPEFETFIKDHKAASVDERRDAIERILDQLPGHFATVLRLHYLERWSQEDIAAQTNENVGTIKARVHRAKAAFRKASTNQLEDLLGD